MLSSSPVCLTIRLGQIFMKLLSVFPMNDVVHTGVDKFLLPVLHILCNVVRHEYDAALSVHHKQEAIQGLKVSKHQERDSSASKAANEDWWNSCGLLAQKWLSFIFTCRSSGPRWSLSMTPWPVDDTSAFWTSSSQQELFPRTEERRK